MSKGKGSKLCSYLRIATIIYYFTQKKKVLQDYATLQNVFLNLINIKRKQKYIYEIKTVMDLILFQLYKTIPLKFRMLLKLLMKFLRSKFKYSKKNLYSR